MHPMRQFRVAAAGLVAAVLVAASSRAQDPPAEIPVGFRGTWLLRLTSDDGGKTYRSGDGKAVCEVGAKEVRFVRKVDFAAEKLAVKAVAADKAKGDAVEVRFDDGTAWKLTSIGGSITATVLGGKDGALKETYRFTVRKQ